MKLRSRLTGTVLIGTLTMFGLAACGSDDSKKDDSDKKDSSSETTEDTGSDDSSDEADGDKPSKDDVVAGFTEAFNTQTGGQIPPEFATTIVTCLIDAIYDDISDESAQALAEGGAVTDPDDQQLLVSATGTCTTEALG